MADFRLTTGFGLWRCCLILGACYAITGCQFFVNDADRQVYQLVDQRQRQAVGIVHDAYIGEAHAPIKPSASAYKFVPHPINSELPPSFETLAASQPADLNGAQPANLNGSNPALSGNGRPYAVAPSSGPQEKGLPPTGHLNGRPATMPANTQATATAPAGSKQLEKTGELPGLEATPPGPKVLTLAESLTYAFQHARDFQNAKEDLYLAALALTLERHMWTPRLVGNIQTQYANFGEINHFDDAMDAVATVGVEQKLPYGGRITAQVVSSLMHDLTNHVTTAETGDTLIRADIPLLKGAGPVAYESRYEAERQLIYAVRTFERFRRFLAVDIASDYFNLQQLRQAIINSRESIEGFEWLALRARAFWKAGRVIELDVQRAEQDQLTAINNQIDAVERYQTALDAFKVRIGMPTEANITVELPQGGDSATQPAGTATKPAELPATAEQRSEAQSEHLVDALAMPAVDEQEAIRVALKMRLDLLNQLDQIGDAERGVVVAENSLLPALDAFGSVEFDTDPSKKGMFQYESDRATWRTGLNLELPLDRLKERNDLRSSLIRKRRAKRAYEQARDVVVEDVRRAMRRVQQQDQLLQFQIVDRKLAQQRLRAAKFRYERSLVASLEVVDAQNALLGAQNRLAQAEDEYKVAILQFWRDTDTLRIGEDGKWEIAMDTKSEIR